MSRQYDSQSELRSAFMNREIRKAKHYLPSGNSGVFVQVTQAVIFMYLIFIGYALMGTIGLVFVSTLFILALLSPFLLTVGKALWNKRKQRVAEEAPLANTEVNQEG